MVGSGHTETCVADRPMTVGDAPGNRSRRAGPTGSKAWLHARSPADPSERHRPEETLLYKTLQAYWTTFVRDLEVASDSPVLPCFVTAEVEAFLRCGILAHGFVLAKYRDCGWARAVAFSCRRRGFCANCIGRKMSDFAAHLVDRVIPRVPVASGS